MATAQEVQNADIRDTFARPVAQTYPDTTIISQAWVAGFAVAMISNLQGVDVSIAPNFIDRIYPSNNPGIFLITVLVALVVFSNAKLRGVYSVLTIVTAAFLVVVLAWFGWWDNILRFIPQLSARASMGFYLFFSSAMLTVWLLAFFVFDRLTTWRIRPLRSASSASRRAATTPKALSSSGEARIFFISSLDWAPAI